MSAICTRHDAKILLLGLDHAGKTSVLHKFKWNTSVSTIPTIGFNLETVQVSRDDSFTVWDIGGKDTIRALWKNYSRDQMALSL